MTLIFARKRRHSLVSLETNRDIFQDPYWDAYKHISELIKLGSSAIWSILNFGPDQVNGSSISHRFQLFFFLKAPELDMNNVSAEHSKPVAAAYVTISERVATFYLKIVFE